MFKKLQGPRATILRLLAFCVLAPLVTAQGSSTGIPMPPDRVADSYAIYSMLIPSQPFSNMSQDQIQGWAIADTTLSVADMNPAVPPQGQLKPPPDNPKGFLEADRDYHAHRNQRVQLTQQFNLNKPYILLTHDQVHKFRTMRSSVNPDSSLQSQYAAYPGITSFSEVYFDSTHSAALVYMYNWCANLCSNGTWIYLEKHNGQWVRRSGVFKKIS
jgi:hypothetical protein